MSDLSITAASVVAGSGARTEQVTWGDTITAGKIVYKDTADGLWKLADTNGASAVIRTAWGMALSGGGSGQPGVVLTEGPVTLGNILTAGEIYVLSATPGGMAPVADLAQGHYTTTLGIAVSATQLYFKIHNGGVARP